MAVGVVGAVVVFFFDDILSFGPLPPAEEGLDVGESLWLWSGRQRSAVFSAMFLLTVVPLIPQLIIINNNNTRTRKKEKDWTSSLVSI